MGAHHGTALLAGLAGAFALASTGSVDTSGGLRGSAKLGAAATGALFADIGGSAPAPAPALALAPPVRPEAQNMDVLLAKATSAAKQAWAYSKEVQAQSDLVLANTPDIKAEASLAKLAAQTAMEQDKKVTEMFFATRTEAVKAAMFASRDYYEKVKMAAARANKENLEKLKAESTAAEVRAARAAEVAAMPYHEDFLRGQKVIVDYQRRAQALAAASNNVKQEGANLVFSAQRYQAAGQVVQANQLMMQAHSLVAQGVDMQKEAERLHGAALEVSAALPAYQQAEAAAAASAAAAANPLSLDTSQFHPY